MLVSATTCSLAQLRMYFVCGWSRGRQCDHSCWAKECETVREAHQAVDGSVRISGSCCLRVYKACSGSPDGQRGAAMMILWYGALSNQEHSKCGYQDAATTCKFRGWDLQQECFKNVESIQLFLQPSSACILYRNDLQPVADSQDVLNVVLTEEDLHQHAFMLTALDISNKLMSTLE